MADQQLLIEINAKVNDAIKGITLVNDRLGKIPPAAGKAGDSFKKLGDQSNRASLAVINFGRVAQDSSFGIIGVANNIEPLFQSFAALRKESTSTGSALKSFFSAIAGPAGIGLLIGAVSLFDAYSNGYGIFAGRAKEAAKAQKDFNEELDAAKAGATSTGLKLQALLKIIDDTTQSEVVRNNALKEANKQLGEYGVKIQGLGTANRDASKFVDDLTESLVQQAVAAKLADKLADIAIALPNALKKQQDAQAKAAAAAKKQRQEQELLNVASVNQSTAITLAFDAQANGNRKVSKAEKEAAAATAEYNRLLAERAELQKIFTKSTAKALEIVKIPPINNNDKDELEKYNAAIRALYESFLITNEAAEKYGRTTVQFEGRVAFINQTVAALEKERIKLEQISALEVARQANNQGVTAPTGLAASAKIPAAILEQVRINANLTQAEIQKVADTVNNVNAAFAILSPAIDQAFNALANGENASEAVTQAIKQMIVQLAKAVIQAAILSAILNAIAPGGAAQSFSSIFSKLLGFRAAGGPVSGGGSYIVGERGPELFTPSRSGTIVPNNELGGGGGGQLVARVSGSDLLFVLTQAQRNNQSIFG